jgi:hypothetical protein
VLAQPATGWLASGAMTETPISAGAVHAIPADLRGLLVADSAARAKWEDITPLARNEWICWIESVKKPETRRNHLERAVRELKEGKRRPCCWPGCPHRVRSPRASSTRRAGSPNTPQVL